ncbi:hypothetical protein G7Y79_00055g089730 [Physcia stellaris]|nr:hypothetical protein G7Y79_00055g089730 [Physcia stellaris]
MSPKTHRPTLRLQIRDLALLFLSLKAWKAPLAPKLPSYDQSKPPRNAVLCNEADDCRYCVELHSRMEFEGPLVVCRPYLWAMDISHLIMMLELRIARSEASSALVSGDVDETPSFLPLEKIDKVIADDIAAVLAHEKICEEDYNDLEDFLKRLGAAKEKLDGIEGFDTGLREGLERVLREIRRCGCYDGWGVFSLGVLRRDLEEGGLDGESADQ